MKIESTDAQTLRFWALLKRSYCSTYHKMSVKHLQKYID